MGQFVDEYGGVEGDREEERDQVARAAEFGEHAVELTAEDPGDEGCDDEPAGGDIDRHTEGTAHEDATARAVGAPRFAAAGVRSPGPGPRPFALTACVVLFHGFPSLRMLRSLDHAVREGLTSMVFRSLSVAGRRVCVMSTSQQPTSLSPSRASDFMQCPLLYRFRVIDKLPEKPSEAATRGTLVHAVLERLFDAPAAERTPPRAKALIPGQWDRLLETKPELSELFAEDEGAGG